jgi:hypothetical protein
LRAKYRYRNQVTLDAEKLAGRFPSPAVWRTITIIKERRAMLRVASDAACFEGQFRDLGDSAA